MEWIGDHRAGAGDLARYLWKVRLLRVDGDDEGGAAWGIKELTEIGRVLEIGADAANRNVPRLEQVIPIWQAESGVDVATDVSATEVALLGHADGGVARIVKDKHLQVQGVDFCGADLLHVL